MIKQVIVIRRDLKMRRGKEIAQGSHASMAFLRNSSKIGMILLDYEKEWLFGDQRKIVCQVNTLEELLDIAKKAKDSNLSCHIIGDHGLTEFSGQKTITCLAIGPHYDDRIDPITSHLKLY